MLYVKKICLLKEIYNSQRSSVFIARGAVFFRVELFRKHWKNRQNLLLLLLLNSSYTSEKKHYIYYGSCKDSIIYSLRL